MSRRPTLTLLIEPLMLRYLRARGGHPTQYTRQFRLPVETEPLSGGEGAATGADKGYDESWIPTDHINRPAARRVKSGPGKPKGKTAE